MNLHLYFQPCHVVYTDYRPTPLQHYIFPAGGDGIHLCVDEKAEFHEENFTTAMNVLKDAGDAAMAGACSASVAVAPQPTTGVDLTSKQIKSIVPKAKGSNKDAIKLSAVDRGTPAQIRKLYMRLGLSGSSTHTDMLDAISNHWGL